MSETVSKPASSLPSLIPLPGKVYLKRVDPVDSTAFPYIIPDAAREKSTECIVVAVPTTPLIEWGQTIPCPVTVGQKVLVGKYAGDYELRKEKVTLVKWDEILAVIEDGEEPEAKEPGKESA
jgi:chaperonin GroES